MFRIVIDVNFTSSWTKVVTRNEFHFRVEERCLSPTRCSNIKRFKGEEKRETDPNMSFSSVEDSMAEQEKIKSMLEEEVPVAQKKYGKQRLLRQGGSGRFCCKVCSKCLSSKDALQVHLRRHTGEKPFCCQICYKAFKQKPHLDNHWRIHTGEKPFQCEVCSKKFNQKANLLKHSLRHKGEKPFECQVCCRKFTQKSNLLFHSSIHTEGDSDKRIPELQGSHL